MVQNNNNNNLLEFSPPVNGNYLKILFLEVKSGLQSNTLLSNTYILNVVYG